MWVGPARHRADLVLGPRWLLSWFVAYPFLRLFIGLRSVGRCNFVEGPQILASNHVTNADPLVLGIAAARELHFLAKEELFQASRVFASLIRSYNAWPVRRGRGDAGAIRQCSRILQDGRALVLFPEGTRSKTGEIAGFMPGVAMLAMANDAPVIPTRIVGLDQTWLARLVDRDFARLGFRHKANRFGGVRVVFGTPVRPSGFSRDRSGYARMTRLIEERVRQLR